MALEIFNSHPAQSDRERLLGIEAAASFLLALLCAELPPRGVDRRHPSGGDAIAGLLHRRRLIDALDIELARPGAAVCLFVVQLDVIEGLRAFFGPRIMEVLLEGLPPAVRRNLLPREFYPIHLDAFGFWLPGAKYEGIRRVALETAASFQKGIAAAGIQDWPRACAGMARSTAPTGTGIQLLRDATRAALARDRTVVAYDSGLGEEYRDARRRLEALELAAPVSAAGFA